MKVIEQIIQQIKDGMLREDASVEMKRMLANKDVLAKELVGLANAGGGHLIVGVEEHAGTCKASGLKQTEEDIANIVNSVCEEFSIKINITLTKVTIEGCDILIVEIKPINSVTYYSRPTSPERLYAFTREKDGRTIQSADTKTYQRIYKYMTLETFITCLFTGTWRFFEPNKWQDKYERRFYCADYQFPNAADAAPKLFATCVTRERNSEASWKVYAGGTGLSQHCLQMEINLVEFRNQLQASGFQVEEKEVIYQQEGYIENLHKVNDSNYPLYFNPFTRRSFISLLSLKRRAYEYEKEVRFFLIPRDPQGSRSYGEKNSDFRDIPLEWNRIIKNVRVSKFCSPAELKSLQQACFAAGINPQFNNYTMMGEGNPYNIPPANTVNIPFELFCIDDMSGPRRLKIK